MFSIPSDFNTSHVTVYRRKKRKIVDCTYISIHLMLLFILARTSFSRTSEHFNTSHVTVYRWKSRCWMEKIKFQYISCYCLSVTEACCHLQIIDFNTSHVTVYRIADVIRIRWTIFQYISCYCLSCISHNLFSFTYISIHLMLLFINAGQFFTPYSVWFQYISCYCLSSSFFFSLSTFQNFNTSHVTVYPFVSLCVALSLYISIHLMLLFIAVGIFPMLLIVSISIHLMLLFIKTQPHLLILFQNFNTSHVTVYR